MASWFSSFRIISPFSSTAFKHAKLSCARNTDNVESSESVSMETASQDQTKLAFNKAKAYKQSVKSDSSSGIEQRDAENSVKEEDDGDGGKKDLPGSVKIAMEKAKKYKQNKGVGVSDAAAETTQGLLRGSEKTSGKTFIDNNSVGKKGELSVSKLDFVGLGFADKKTTRGLPPGLVPISDSFSDGDFSEVELIVGDSTQFDAAKAQKPEQTKEDESEFYKPKVSTWGVFPRPGNISKTYGGGRVIRPGEVLETEEEKAVKEARTKQLLAAYNKEVGLNIDPKLKSECEEALKDGDLLMNTGKLKGALPYYEKVMDKLTFKSELHGLAALQWSICQDSLNRPKEARSMYEKLQSHPNAKVNKKARQFMYSFQAMEMMKITTGSQFYLKNTSYQNYFDAFIENKSDYPVEDDVVQESGMNQVPIKLGIQADRFISDKCLGSLKLSSSENQDGKSIGTDMKKSKSIKLSDLEALQSPPSRILQTTAPSPQKQKKPLVRTTAGSPNYMKPTCSSEAKKELFQVSLQNTQSGSDGKKASSVYSKKPEKTLTSSSSLNLIRTLSMTPSYKTSSACPKKSTTAVMCADGNVPERATCSSTLKNSKFPSYLMLNYEGTESEGASVMKVCSYKYCSLNDPHLQPSLPPLKSFMSARTHLLKTQKSMKLKARSPQILKVPCETKKDNDIEHENVFDGKPAYDEANVVSPIITPLAGEIDMHFFIEVHVKENEGDIEDQQQMKFTLEENGLAAEEDGVKQVTPNMTHAVPKFEIDLEEDFKNCFGDVTIEANANGSFYQEQNAEDADEIQQPTWFHEEVSVGSYSSKVSYDEENVENIELDVSDSRYTDLEWEEEHRCGSSHEEDIDSSVSTEETDSKSESFLERLPIVSAMRLHDIASSHNVDILVEEAVQEANEEENTCSETEPQGTNSFLEGTSEGIETHETDYSSNRISCDQSSSTEEVFQHLTDEEHNNRENEKHVGDEASCATKIFDQQMVENSEGHKMIEACEIDENREDSDSSRENNDESISKEKQTITAVQDLQLLEGDQVKANKLESSSFICDEKENASKNWQWTTRRQRRVQDDEEEMRKIKPRNPNFLPSVPDQEPEKVNLKHQMMDERKNADEWMLDFALRQAVTKLAPAGNTKVALLVQAFETVMSIPKCETHTAKLACSL